MFGVASPDYDPKLVRSNELRFIGLRQNNSKHKTKINISKLCDIHLTDLVSY